MFHPKMTDNAESFWPVLNDVQWDDVFKTFGSCHSTLLGAFVRAWNCSARDRFALESGCSPTEGHLGSNFCDAILCKGDYFNPTPVGILEVEGKPFPSRKLKNGETAPTIFERMKHYWFPDGKKAKCFQYFKNLSFAVLVVYPFGAVDEKYVETKEKLLSQGPSLLKQVREVKSDFRLFVVIVHKYRDDSIKGSIRENFYYAGTISYVEWFEVTCADDQTMARSGGKTNPRADPKPLTVAYVIEELLAEMSEDAKNQLRKLKRNELGQCHFGLALYIRNKYIHGQHGELEADCQRLMGESGLQPYLDADGASGYVVECLWRRLRVGIKGSGRDKGVGESAGQSRQGVADERAVRERASDPSRP